MAAGTGSTQTSTSSTGLGDIIKIGDLGSLLLKLGIAILIVILLLFLSKILSDFVKKKLIANLTSEKDEYSRKVAILISDIVFYILIVFSLFIGFEILGFNVGVILGGISFGIGFAFKEILGNMIAGIMILTTKEFKLGDIIELQDGSNVYFGRIEEITIRYTLIRTLELRKLIMPNINLITLPIKTFTSEDFVRLETIISVHYDTDLDKASEIIKDAINGLDFIIEKDKTKILVDTFGDSGIILKAWYFFDPNGGEIYPVIQSDVNRVIYDTCMKDGIVISYPHTVITFDKNDKNLLGNLLYLIKKAKE